MPDALQKLAPTKVNLCLHVGPVRKDGLHELASLAVFPQFGDVISISDANSLTLEVTGPFAEQLRDVPPESNLVIRAAHALQKAAAIDNGAKITLEKHVPAASGIGGGTSDATTTLFLLRDLWQAEISDDELLDLAFTIGADGPVCLMPHLSATASVSMRGAGEEVAHGPDLPQLWMCLINPLQEVPTGPVFRAFDEANPAPDSPKLPRFTTMADFGNDTRNDLQPFAEQLCPEIVSVLATLSAQSDVIWTRMSGSGATCFGLYETADAAMAAADTARQHGWWGKTAKVLTLEDGSFSNQ
ncbi:MAG: 4-(cytidine 5'-diphospho)-2-C-methyl-D-erythritol kinase [Aquisalinus sp.]|nr:4-(cytidine 5'-diphospho)-2-C-methyl-D-erythritol kinase [Aquisalinus sp.]